MSLRTSFVWTLIAISFCSCSNLGRNPEKARALAQASYADLSTNPFSMQVMLQAQRTLEKAHKMGPKESWVHIAMGQLALVSGHDAGNWYSPKTHQPEMVAQAGQEALKAIGMDSTEAMAWSFQALVHLLQNQTVEATVAINKAHELDSSLFQPYLLRAVLMRRSNQFEDAQHWYQVALRHAEQTFEKRQVLREQAVLARARNLPEEEFSYLMQQATLEPQNPWSQGLVAEWYMEQENFAEAVRWWEATVAIAPFRRAESQLAKARAALASR